MDDLPRLSDADRRFLRWAGVAVLAAVAGVATLPWTLRVAERLDPLTALAVVGAIVVAALVAVRAKGKAASGLLVAVLVVAVALLAGAVLFAACAGSGCVR